MTKDEHVREETAGLVLAVISALSQHHWAAPNATHSLEYERWVEAPRRRGIDPVWQSLLNEALGDREAAVRKAG